MKLRQEQIVFLVALLLLAFLAWRVVGKEGAARRGGTGGSDPAELVRYPAPDLEVALQRETTFQPLQRDLLSPPSDTRPLPPLGIIEPPRAPLAALFPPTEPGPAPAAFGALLRREFSGSLDLEALADLFAEVDTGLGGVDYNLDDFELFTDPSAGSEEPSMLEALAEASAAVSRDTLFEDLTPQEAEQVIQGWKEQYDWFDDQVNVTFGRIENKDRYGLKTNKERGAEPLLFVEINPRTGIQRFGSLDAIEIDLERALEWDFAGTFANRIEVRRRELGDSVSRSTYNVAMALADECVRGRLDAVRSLEIAEELYDMCATFDVEDPAPRLGRARCYEAGFAFDKAFTAYNELIVQFDHRAEVHARLGALEARFYLFEQAEERLKHAVAVDRGSWEARWELGRFLAGRGRHGAALEHLKQANKSVPNDPERLMDRVGIRVDLASAELALGNVGVAHTLFGRALSTDPDNQRARAGYVATEIFALEGGVNGVAAPPEATGSGEPGLELLLARGLEAAAIGDLATAKGQLEAAAEADPLRANYAWRALSFIAEMAGQDGEAQRFIELALECDPTDAWALYQAGRLRAKDEDVAGAREAFLKALDRELDFVDALAALGEMAYRMGDFADADRYLERAVVLEPDRAALHALRGLNFLLLESPPEAQASFEAGLAIDRNAEVCRAGVSWCTYLAGDTEQALVQLRELDDSLRSQPPEDPMRVWAKANIERIQDHEEKVEWSDVFDRKQIRNDWDVREDAGPVHRIVDGEVTLEGSFSATGDTLLYRTMAATLFVAVEADVWVEPSTKANVGIFLAREQERRTSRTILSRIAVIRHHDGSLQVNVVKEGEADPTFVDMEYPFPTGQWVRLRIERIGDEAGTHVTLFADGIPLIENVPMSTLRAATPIQIGFMAAGEPGRAVKAKLDNFKVVYRK